MAAVTPRAAGRRSGSVPTAVRAGSGAVVVSVAELGGTGGGARAVHSGRRGGWYHRLYLFLGLLFDLVDGLIAGFRLFVEHFFVRSSRGHQIVLLCPNHSGTENERQGQNVKFGLPAFVPLNCDCTVRVLNTMFLPRPA